MANTRHIAESVTLNSEQGASYIGAEGGGTVQDALPGVSVKQYGAVGDGVTDDSAAIIACLTENAGKKIYFPAPDVAYLVGQSLGDIPARTQLIGPGRYQPCILKAFSGGYLLNLLDGVQIRDMTIDGGSQQGYSGGLIDVPLNQGRQAVDNCRFYRVQGGDPIHFNSVSGSPAQSSGSQSNWSNIEVWRSDGTSGSGNYAIVHDGPDVESPGHPISMHHIETAGMCSINFGNCNNWYITNSTLFDIALQRASLGVHVANARIAPVVGPIVLNGSVTMDGVGFGPLVQIATGSFVNLSNCYFNNGWEDLTTGASPSAITDAVPYSYTPVIDCNGTPITLGNGTLTGQYVRTSGKYYFTVTLTVGTTTVIPAGQLAVTLPFIRSRINNQCLFNGYTNVGGVRRFLSGLIIANNKVSLFDTATGAGATNSVPQDITAAGSVLSVTGWYVK